MVLISLENASNDSLLRFVASSSHDEVQVYGLHTVYQANLLIGLGCSTMIFTQLNFSDSGMEDVFEVLCRNKTWKNVYFSFCEHLSPSIARMIAQNKVWEKIHLDSTPLSAEVCVELARNKEWFSVDLFSTSLSNQACCILLKNKSWKFVNLTGNSFSKKVNKKILLKEESKEWFRIYASCNSIGYGIMSDKANVPMSTIFT